MFSLAELLTPPESLNGDTEMTDATAEDTSQSDDALTVDISLTTSPSPVMHIIFPLPKLTGGLASVDIGISSDGEISLSRQNLIAMKEGGYGNGDDAANDGEGQVRRLGRALEVVGSLGVWIEWLRSQFGGD